MNLLADEGVDRPIVKHLRDAGFTVLYVAEMEPGISDDEVLNQANQHNALLLTADKDFGELVFRLGRINGGVVLLRLAGLATETKANTVVTAIQMHAPEMMNAFSVVSPGVVRIRAKH